MANFSAPLSKQESQSMPTLLDELETPAILIDRLRLDANIRRMQTLAERNDVALRPHVKTHRSVTIARLQREAGSRGLTVAKPAEADVFIDHGFEDVRIAYPLVGRRRLERVARLLSHARVSFCVDTREGAEAASAYLAEQGIKAEVLLEVDTGHHRTGVDPSHPTAVDFARHVAGLPGLRLVGILTHAGHGYFGPAEGETKRDALSRAAAEERDTMLRFAVALREAGIPGVDPNTFEISIGSTPTMSAFENREIDGFRITEIRPGNYVFNDAIQTSLGAARLTDCSLTVLATVVSRHRDTDGTERVFIDAGKKVLTSDRGFALEGFGIPLFNASTMTPLPHAQIVSLSEEHGWLRVPGGATLAVGDRVRIVPNHACVVMSTLDKAWLVGGDQTTEQIEVDARGHSF